MTKTFILSPETLEYLEELAMKSNCCSNRCLRKIWTSPTNFEAALDLLKAVRKQMYHKTLEETKTFLRAIVIANNPNCFDTSSESRLSNLKYTLGFQLKEFTPVECCVNLFRMAYNISLRQINNLRSDLRSGYITSSAPTTNEDSFASYGYTDKSIESNTNIKEVVKTRKAAGDPLTQHEKDCLKIPNNYLAKLTSLWMEAHFNLVGDHMPNKANEIHLETIEKKEIWLEYVNDCANIFKLDKCMGYSHFTEFWSTYFNHVKIREYKAVSGKCYMCSILSSLRKKFTDNALRADITELHALHRITYMSERRFYYARIKKGCEDPLNHLSLIGDGMAENHTNLPWLGNLREATKTLNQHLQGMLVHGQILRIFRFFPFTMHDSNMAIFCFLATLEYHYLLNGNKLPDTVYYQVDGGSENCNVYLIAICELIIIRRLCKRIYLTRLPVGHTHEDIDSKFGKIWKYMRTTYQYTPQEYEKSVRSVFKKGKLSFDFHDQFVVPDFKRFFMPTANGVAKFLDPKFSRYAKEETTQLAWRFIATKRCKDFPLGCKTHHKPYFSDTVYEILPDLTGQSYCGYKVAKVTSKWMPQISDHNPTGGMYILQRLPNQPLYPAEFTVDGREKLLAAHHDFRTSYGLLESHSDYKDEWATFVNEIAPQNNEVYDFIETKLNGQFHIPFKDVLFPDIDIITTKSGNDFNGFNYDSEDEVAISEHALSTIVESSEKEYDDIELANDGNIASRNSVTKNIQIVTAGESVNWSNRGLSQPVQQPRINTHDGTDVQQKATPEELEMARLRNFLLPREDYSVGLTNQFLQEMCVARGLKKSFKNKKELIERLVLYDKTNNNTLSPNSFSQVNQTIDQSSNNNIVGDNNNGDNEDDISVINIDIPKTFAQAVGFENDDDDDEEIL